MFHTKFHTILALRKLLAGQSEVEKKLMTKVHSRLQRYLESMSSHLIIYEAIDYHPPHALLIILQ